MNGDLQGKTARVARELQQLKYPGVVDEVGLRLGDPLALLPILHFVLLKFSRHVAQCIHKAGYELQGKTDQKFVEAAFRLFRDCFSIKTVLTPGNFLEQGFAERKLILVSDVIQCCKKIHNDEIRKERLAALKAKQGPGAEGRLYEPTRKTPEVKVVRGAREVKQVISPLHLPNSSDGGQSRFKVTQKVILPAGRAGGPGSSAAGAPADGAEDQASHLRSSFDRAAAIAAAWQRQYPAPSPQASGLPVANSQPWLGTDVLVPAASPPASQHAHAWAARPTSGQATRAGSQSPRPTLQQPDRALQGWDLNSHGYAQPHATVQSRSDPHAEDWQQGTGTGQQAQWARQPQYVSSLQAAPHTPAGLELTFKPPALSSLATPIHGWFVNPAYNDDLHEQSTDQQANLDAGLAATEQVLGSFKLDSGGKDAAVMSMPQNPYLQLPNDYMTAAPAHDEAMQPEGAASGTGIEREGGAGAWKANGTRSSVPAECRRMADSSDDDGDDDEDLFEEPARYYNSDVQHRSFHHQPTLAGSGSQLQARAPQQVQVVTGVQQGSTHAAHASTAGTVTADAQMQKAVTELRDLVESLQAEAARARSEARSSNEVLQARVTVLEGRVRHLECELEVCVRRGEYHYQPSPGAQHALLPPPPQEQQQGRQQVQQDLQSQHELQHEPGSLVNAEDRQWQSLQGSHHLPITGSDRHWAADASGGSLRNHHHLDHALTAPAPQPGFVSILQQQDMATIQGAHAADTAATAQACEPSSQTTVADADPPSRQWDSAATTQESMAVGSQNVSSEYQHQGQHQHQYTGWLTLDAAAHWSGENGAASQDGPLGGHSAESARGSQQQQVGACQPLPDAWQTDTQQQQPEQQQQQPAPVNCIKLPSFGQYTDAAGHQDGNQLGDEPATHEQDQLVGDALDQASANAHCRTDVQTDSLGETQTGHMQPHNAHAAVLQGLMPQHTAEAQQSSGLQHKGSSAEATAMSGAAAAAVSHHAPFTTPYMPSTAAMRSSMASSQTIMPMASTPWGGLGGGAPTPSFAFEPARVMSEVRASQNLGTGIRQSGGMRKLGESEQSWSHVRQSGDMTAVGPTHSTMRTSTGSRPPQFLVGHTPSAAAVPPPDSAHSTAADGWHQPANGGDLRAMAASAPPVRDSWHSVHSGIQTSRTLPQPSGHQGTDFSTGHVQPSSSYRQNGADMDAPYRYSGVGNQPSAVASQYAGTAAGAAVSGSSSSTAAGQAVGSTTSLPGSTSQLISSLMSRYSEAQTFLAEIKRK